MEIYLISNKLGGRILIEDYWEDVMIYYVTFESKKNQCFTRCLVFSEEEYEQKNIEEIVLTKFKEVKCVLKMDFLEEGLFFKNKEKT